MALGAKNGDEVATRAQSPVHRSFLASNQPGRPPSQACCGQTKLAINALPIPKKEIVLIIWCVCMEQSLRAPSNRQGSRGMGKKPPWQPRPLPSLDPPNHQPPCDSFAFWASVFSLPALPWASALAFSAAAWASGAQGRRHAATARHQICRWPTPTNGALGPRNG